MRAECHQVISSDPDVALERLGRRLRVRRAELGVTQEGVANRAQLNRTYVGEIERGEASPTLTTLIALAQGLEMTLAELVDGLDDPT